MTITPRCSVQGKADRSAESEVMWSEFLHAMQLGTVAHGGYQDGRAVDLRSASHKPFYLVGDIHAKPARIGQVLEHAQLEPLLENDEAVLVFLGDLFHREDDSRAGEMESSLETLEILARLKTRFPRSVYSLLGNHEMTRTESTKRGYFQGELFRRALRERGLDGIYNSWLEASPLFVTHPRLVGVHAGPAVSAQSLEQLKQVPVRDVDPWEQVPEVRELLFTRHVDWSPIRVRATPTIKSRTSWPSAGFPTGA